ncbi:hypothetical protein GOODEAATRI_014319, partial [Goodea atripinnis]
VPGGGYLSHLLNWSSSVTCLGCGEVVRTKDIDTVACDVPQCSGRKQAVRDISVAPLNADDQTLLEQMMDQEDGVRNRQGKKSWKRSYSMSLRRPRLTSQ